MLSINMWKCQHLMRGQTMLALKTASMSSSASPSSAKTAILMLNMGGPKDVDEVEPFLRRLFLDSDIIKLPMQNILGPFIAKRRAPKVAAKYMEIGGGSPIKYWSERQGNLICEKLDRLSPQTAPHKSFLGFSYANPLLEDTLQLIERENIPNVIAFSQFAQYCCNTSGSSFNSIAKYYAQSKPAFKFSFIDRWSTNPGLVKAFTKLIQQELLKFPAEDRDKVLLLFTAHSLPLSSVNSGDPYPVEVAGTVMQVMHSLKFSHPFRLVWQSKVGPMPWQGPSTEDALKGFIGKGYKNLMLIPISFVNEHIETLHELDIEYCKDLCDKLPVKLVARCPAPNDHPDFIDGMVDCVLDHIKSDVSVPPQMLVQCPLCTKDVCARTRQWLAKLA